MEPAVGSREHDAGGVDIEHFDAAVRQGGENDHVEVVDEGVRQPTIVRARTVSWAMLNPVAGQAMNAGGVDTADLIMLPTTAGSLGHELTGSSTDRTEAGGRRRPAPRRRPADRC